ncbi:MAG: hypothetical protein LBG84_05635 [Treponema sp.]|jgi:hypothetical protein|nr:hypothetical protein [Treponema sp.]
MKNRPFLFWPLPVLLFLTAFPLGAEPIRSPAWGFRLDLPEGYEFSGGDGRDQFSFRSSFGSILDLTVKRASSPNPQGGIKTMAEELGKNLSSRGETRFFSYHGRAAALMELRFSGPRPRAGGNPPEYTGHALLMELEMESRPILVALAYGPDREELRGLHLSALDSLEGGEGDHRLPGPVTECLYPPGAWEKRRLAGQGGEAFFRKNDESAAQALVDREFAVLRLYRSSPLWREAWKRFYRAIFKDSYDRLKDAAFILERGWNGGVENQNTPGTGGQAAPEASGGTALPPRNTEARLIAAKALEWVQGFRYERDLLGSDFVNLITAVREGRGDCDSRALLWAIILEQANIPAGIMVSREYSHAMGMADLEGPGARFPMKDEAGADIRWIVAETAAQVNLGLIEQGVSDPAHWLGILFY